MADASPLLPETIKEGCTLLPPSPQKERHETNRAQLFQGILVSIPWAVDAQHTFINIFADAPQSWHCISNLCDPRPGDNLPCSLPAGSWEWDKPTQSSTATEWALQCPTLGGGGVGPPPMGLPHSAFFLGSLLGGLILAAFGVGDSSLGRKRLLFIACLVTSLAGFLTAAAPDPWSYVCLRFVAGFARSTILTSSLVLVGETVCGRWRSVVMSLGFFIFAGGFLSLPPLAYPYRNSSWRNLYLWISVPAFCCSFLILFFAHESPRYLLLHGQRDEAMSVLKKLGPLGDFSLSEDGQLEETEDMLSRDRSDEEKSLFSALATLVRKRWGRRRLGAVMVAAFGVSLLYYGVLLAVGEMENSGNDLYVRVTMNALAEFPASLATMIVISKADRRPTQFCVTLGSAAFALMTAAAAAPAPKWVQLGAEVVAFLLADTGINLVVVYATEMFPTCVRNSGLAMARQAFALASVAAPLVAAAGRQHGLWASFGVFGVVGGCSGMFALCLPETRGKPICDTMEEQELRDSPGIVDGIETKL